MDLRLLAVAIGALTVCGGEAQGEETGVAGYGHEYVAARAAIDSANTAWCEAYKAHDVAGVMAIWAANPVALSGEGQVAAGKEPLEASATAIMRYNPIRASVGTQQVWLVGGDSAYEYGSYTITFVPEVTDTVVFTERYVAEWRRQRGGEWRIRLKMGLPSP